MHETPSHAPGEPSEDASSTLLSFDASVPVPLGLLEELEQPRTKSASNTVQETSFMTASSLKDLFTNVHEIETVL